MDAVDIGVDLVDALDAVDAVDMGVDAVDLVDALDAVDAGVDALLLLGTDTGLRGGNTLEGEGLVEGVV